MPHYVYLYRDESRKPRYVGYGELVTRANAHLAKSHNLGLADFVLEKKFSIEVAGPFGSERVGRVVETAVISALTPDLNVVQGRSDARFRPLGVPVAYAERLLMQPLERKDFFSLQTGPSMPVLFVSVGDKDFGDGRTGYDLANPPTDAQILERVVEWWQLSALVPWWAQTPNQSPGLLIGITGRPGSQIVIASLMVNRHDWNNARPYPHGQGKISIPLLATPGLDAFELRGRRVRGRRNGVGTGGEAPLAFGGVPAEFFIVLEPNGKSYGGRRPRKNRLTHQPNR